MILGNASHLPQADSLKNSREMSFFSNDYTQPDAECWSPSLTEINAETPQKEFDLHRRYGIIADEECSTFYSLLRFLCEAKATPGETLVIIGGNWRSAQFELLEELFPRVTVNLWLARIIDPSNLSSNVKKRTGFPSPATYRSYESLLLFSDFRSSHFSNIMYDFDFQQKVVDTCVPRAASVRFRPPLRRNFSSNEITFLEGRMTTNCCALATDIASRVYVTRDEHYVEGVGFRRQTYNLKQYEEKMNHYNSEVRSCYKYDYRGVRKDFDDAYQDFICELHLGASAFYKEISHLKMRIRFVCVDLSPKL